MATLIIGAAAALGSTATGVGAASLYLATTAISVASAAYSIYSTLNKPKPPGIEGPRIGDLSVQSSTRGAPLPKVWGSMRLSGNVIHAKKYEVATTTETSGGKGFMGGGGGGVTQTTYSYFADFAISLCEGPITGVRRVWMNNRLWYTAADDAGDLELEASDDNEQYGKVYLGTTSQLPDPTLEAIHGVGNVPPYRRTAYIVFTRLPLVNFGNAIPQVSVEVCNTPSTFTAPTGLCGGDPGSVFGNPNMVRDPDTGRVFFTTFDTPNMRVFDSSMECLALIGLPGKVSNDPISTPCYVPTTREIWGAYNTSASEPTILVVDPDALALKATLAVVHVGSGPAFYNPVTDDVIVHDHQIGGLGTKFDPQTRTITGRINLFGSGLCFGSVYLTPHDAIVSWGHDNHIRFVKASDYSLIAELVAAPFGNLHNFCCYDPGRDVLYWCNSQHTNLYTIDLSGLPTAPVLGSARTLPMEPALGMVYVSSTDKIYARGIIVGVEDFKILDPDTLAQTGFIEDFATSSVGLYAIDGRRFIISGDRVKVPIRGLLPNTGIPLAEIVEDLCIGAGLLDDDIDVSQLNTPTVHGYVRAQPMQATAAISPLMLAYQFDGVESDWLLQFPKRGGASIATLLEDNLGAREAGQEPGAPLVISRQQETDLPTALTVHYREPALSYQQGSQIHRRVYTLSQNTIEIDFPLAITRTKARKLVRTLMNRSWTERTRYQFALGPEYLYLDPADLVKIESDNATHMVRLDKVDFGAPGLVLCEGVAQRITLLPFEDEKAQDLDAAPIYDEDNDEDGVVEDDPAPPDTFPAPVLIPVPATRLVLLDIPMLLDAHNDAGFYYAVAGHDAGWGGAVLHKSIDAGASYAAWDAMNVAAAIGASSDVLASGPTTIFDEGSSVTVVMVQGTLASATAAAVLNGANLGALGAHGRWELVQWRTATLVSAGTYTLSGLLRGRKGTEHAVGTHAAGDTFVVLTSATIDRTPGAASEIGLERYWKGVSFGQSLADTAATTFANTAVALRPYSPADLAAVDNGDGTWDLTWVRRTRADGEWRDAVEVSLAEASESYSVEVLNGAIPVSTAIVTVPSATVTAVAGYTVKVAQISEVVGPGYYSEITLSI